MHYCSEDIAAHSTRDVARTNVSLECVFRPSNSLPIPRRQMRSRGMSELSQQSIASNEDDVLLGNRLSYPVRQPYGAPDSLLAQRQGFRHRPIRQPNKPPPSLIGARVEGFLTFPQKAPSRQPLSPPSQPFSSASELAIQHAGFQRFLKEHASPPHHRVTAGGRIVPNTGPPPMFNVNSLTGTIMSPTRQDATKPSTSAKVNEVPETAASFAGPRFASAASKHGIMISGGSEQSEIAHSPTPRVQKLNKNTTPNSAAQAPQDLPIQPSAGLAPIMLLQDGTTFVMQNGLPHRVYSNGFNTYTEPVPLLYAQNSSIPGISSAAPSQQGVLYQPNTMAPQGPHSNIPLTKSGSIRELHSAQSGQEVSDETLLLQHGYLRNELQGLDRHIALHGKKFGRHEQLAFVALRKQLVHQLDQYRRQLSRTSSSENASHQRQDTYPGTHHRLSESVGYDLTIDSFRPLVPERMQPGIGLSARDSKPSDPTKTKPITTEACMTGSGTAQQLKTPSLKSSAGNAKVLSPEAPPFVPSRLRVDDIPKSEPNIPYSKSKDGFPEPRSIQQTMNGRPAFGQIQVDSASLTQPPSSFSHVKGETSGSAMNAIVPDIHEKDIAYVDAMGLNPIYGAKKYCSTAAEFQEVIRRVREQARLYGCKGGSSKDPEFDAEQDIRWAISDATPIPLPKKVPDHIVHPRPWFWNDSAFNIHADRSCLRKANADEDIKTLRHNNAGNPVPNSARKESNYPDESLKDVYKVKQEVHHDMKRSLVSISAVHDHDRSDTGFPFSSSRQAAILRETRKILGNVPPNVMASDSAYPLSQRPSATDQRSQGTISKEATAHGSLNSNPNQRVTEREIDGNEGLGAEPSMTLGPNLAAKPIVRLPIAQQPASNLNNTGSPSHDTELSDQMRLPGQNLKGAPR